MGGIPVEPVSGGIAEMVGDPADDLGVFGEHEVAVGVGTGGHARGIRGEHLGVGPRHPGVGVRDDPVARQGGHHLPVRVYCQVLPSNQGKNAGSRVRLAVQSVR